MIQLRVQIGSVRQGEKEPSVEFKNCLWLPRVYPLPPAPPSFLAAHGIEDSCSWQSNQSQRAKGKLGPRLIRMIENSRLRHQVSPNVPGVCMHKPQIAEAVGKYLKAGGSSAGVFSADHRPIQG